MTTSPYRDCDHHHRQVHFSLGGDATFFRCKDCGYQSSIEEIPSVWPAWVGIFALCFLLAALYFAWEAWR